MQRGKPIAPPVRPAAAPSNGASPDASKRTKPVTWLDPRLRDDGQEIKFEASSRSCATACERTAYADRAGCLAGRWHREVGGAHSTLTLDQPRQCALALPGGRF